MVSEDEADEIRAKIVALANLIIGQQAEGKQQHRAPYHTVYTHFSISSYKRIRQRDYEKVLEFLDGWKNGILAGEEGAGERRMKSPPNAAPTGHDCPPAPAGAGGRLSGTEGVARGVTDGVGTNGEDVSGS